MMLGERLSGFLTLLPPDDVPALNFEDHDLLKTAGRHIATHIEQVEADRRLAEVSQFGAYNRLTAFLMHDLKNLIAQQSLVVKNAEIYRHNPEFVDDAIDTIAHSVSRMRKVIQQLGSVSKQPAKQRFDARAALKEAVDSSMTLQPKPSLKMCQEPLFIRADQERLTLIFEHLIRNAQDATESSGMINVSCKLIHGQIEISIEDTGIGMSREFIRERLFRPFDSTKGSESMGVGAYQARDYVQGLSGNIDVSSELGKGTVFTIRFPVDVDIVTR